VVAMAKDISYDTETTGLYLHGPHEMFSYSTCGWDGEIDICRLDGSKKRQVANNSKLDEMFTWKPQFSSPVVMHNSKFDLTATEKHLGRHVAEDVEFHDTYMQSHILQSNHPSHRLKDLAWELAGIPKDDESAVKSFVAEGGNYSNVPEQLMDEYQRWDAERTMLLHRFLYPKIQASAAFSEIYQMELDLVKTTMRMEERGLMLNVPRTEKMIYKLEQDVEGVLDKIEEFAGERVNPNKTSQLAWLLFDKAKLPILERTAKSKQPKMDKNVIAQLRESNPHAVLDNILQFRSWSRGSTMLQSYLDYADGEGIIHPDIRTCGAKTSRQSSSRPNLQNVQKEGVLLNPYPIPARQCFRPRPGYVNFHLDYSGIELRLLVDYAGEDKLRKIIINGGDPHEPASLVFFRDRFKNARGDLRATLRGASKNMNFAIPYGAAAYKVALGLGMPFEMGKERFEDYRAQFPGLCGLNPRMAALVREQGYVETKFGRWLWVPRNKSYMGTNYLIQGTAAGILKRAQIKVHSYLQRATSGEVRMLLPIHDELVFEFPRKRLGEAGHIFREVRRIMIDFPMFDVPLEVDVQVATFDWSAKKMFNILV